MLDGLFEHPARFSPPLTFSLDSLVIGTRCEPWTDGTPAESGGNVECPYSSAPVVNWQSLVLMKIYAGGPVDLQDAKGILAVRKPNEADQKRLTVPAKALGLAEKMQALLDFPSRAASRLARHFVVPPV